MLVILLANMLNARIIPGMSPGEKQYPTVLQKRVIWLALTLLSLLFVVVLACGCAYGLIKLFVALEAVLLPVLIAGILAYLLNPIVGRIQRKVGKRIWAVLIVMFGAFSLLTGLFFCIVPPLVKQSNELYDNRSHIADNIVSTTKKLINEDRYVQQVVDLLYRQACSEDKSAAPTPAEGADPSVAEDSAAAVVVATPDAVAAAAEEEVTYGQKLRVVMDHHSGYLVKKGAQWLTAGGRFLFGMVYSVIGAIIIPVFLFYFMLESEPIAKNWDKVLPLRNSRLKDEIVATLSEINQNLVAFVRGQLLVSLIDAFILGIALACLGLPYALTIAAAVAVLGIIPYIGMIATSIPAMLVAWFTWNDVGMVIAVACVFLSVSQLDSWVLQPKIVGKNMKMHDMTVMFSVLFWSLVFGGVLGALVAVPLTSAIKVIFKRYVWEPLTDKHAAE